MRFTTAKDCAIWIKTGNHLADAVEKVTEPYERKLGASKDIRLQALSSDVFELTKQFRKELEDAMERKWE